MALDIFYFKETLDRLIISHVHEQLSADRCAKRCLLTRDVPTTGALVNYMSVNRILPYGQQKQPSQDQS